MSNDISRYSKRIVQLFWDPEPKHDNSLDAPIWCLGRKYDCPIHTSGDRKLAEAVPVREKSTHTLMKQDSPRDEQAREDSRRSSFEQVEPISTVHKSESSETLGWPEEFLDDFEARIWLTYRSNFPPIARVDDTQTTGNMSFTTRLRYQISGQNGFTSDTGWGCMIRSGQSLLANTLAVLRFGRARGPFRVSHQLEERELLTLFSDDPRAPFSIHKFVEHGASACGTYPGQWFGPSATAKCIQALSNSCESAGLKVYVTGDGPDVYEDTLMKVARSASGDFCPTLLLVGTRLGIDRITPVYWDALKASLQMPQSVGIAGGRPSSSHYFVGMQHNQFFYLDPHHTRPALPFHAKPEDYTTAELDSCHTRRLRKLDVQEMDPSMLIGFLLRTEEDWQSWKHTVSDAPGRAIFHVADMEPSRYGCGAEREGALHEVETFDDDGDEGF